MAAYYASLVGPLRGMYFPLPPELQTDEQRRRALATSRLDHLWCAIYPREEVSRQIADLGRGEMLSEGFARQLDYDHHAVFVGDGG